MYVYCVRVVCEGVDVSDDVSHSLSTHSRHSLAGELRRGILYNYLHNSDNTAVPVV